MFRETREKTYATLHPVTGQVQSLTRGLEAAGGLPSQRQRR